MPVYLNAMGIVCALGSNAEKAKAALFSASPSGLQYRDDVLPGKALMLGVVDQVLPSLQHWPVDMQGRNNALLQMALDQIRPQVASAIERFGATRVAVIVGTSTSGIGEAEQALHLFSEKNQWPASFSYAQQEMGTSALFVRQSSGAQGPAWTISTACSSSAKALMSAARLLQMGVVDAVIAGGADSMCRFTVAGFSALEAVSAHRCNPFSVNRCGINIGEGAALFLMTRESGPVTLSGWGETSDAHHMSAPDPEGKGAMEAMEQALMRAGWSAEDVDYINLHGTATGHNDAMESLAVQTVLGAKVAASSTKPLTGHTLGASGAIEAALCWMVLNDNDENRLPPHWWDGEYDPEIAALALVPVDGHLERPVRRLLSNSFAFGGSNAVLAMAKSESP